MNDFIDIKVAKSTKSTGRSIATQESQNVAAWQWTYGTFA